MARVIKNSKSTSKKAQEQPNKIQKKIKDKKPKARKTTQPNASKRVSN